MNEADVKKLDEAEYYLSLVYLNWGRSKDMDVKEDFAQGYNIIRSFLENRPKRILTPTKKGWTIK